MSDPELLGRTIEKTHVWLNDLADEMETDDRRLALRVLRAFLHTVRDRLTVDEAAHLAAQLPDLIRGIYYEDWVPSRNPATYHTVEEFLDRIVSEAKLEGRTEASYACTAAARVLKRHVSEGELEDVLAILPAELRTLVAG